MTTMTKDYYELDPDGDVIFIFPVTDPESANQKAVPPKSESTIPDKLADDSIAKSCTSVPSTEAQQFDQDGGNRQHATPKDAKVVRMRVSSKHLSLASPVFKKMLNGPWQEAQGLRVGEVEIEMDWQNIVAMLILMNAIHGHWPDVPRDVSLQTLTEISILVDYYDCHKAIHLVLDLWIQPLQAEMAKEFCDDIVRWIWISWVFRLEDPFRYATHCAVTQSEGPISSLGLPIPHQMIDAIQKRRENCLKITLGALRRFVTGLRDGQGSCCFQCDSSRLGALTIQLHAKGILGPLNEGTIPSVSLNQLFGFIANIKTPVWCNRTSKPGDHNGYQLQHSQHPCTLRSVTQPMLDHMTCRMRGCGFEEFKECAVER